LADNLFEEWIMDNQKPSDGSGRNVGSEGAGASMGKDVGGSEQGGARKVLDKAEAAAGQAVERLAGSAHEGVDKVSGALSEAGTRVSEKSKQLADAYQHFAETGRGYVRSSPATSVLVALAAGYALARIFSSRR
jgi:ElaB/YqjD/DUF883 family membrane-anchored ribosome-binding protein